ncbi:2TM domain-containing protein [Dehalococcoides mccartyi]|uniref:Acetyl-CoA carboxylase, biotin carboxylase n=1 Tax=Dehalococcoides mccartyi (strain VS) TaxID=311424 RepID=D2BG53_DEHMV|nr:2TM domain-containing protein [Dehalococcoides mccartyi]ACZ61303.1 acetyl-CoA carboxylase, biotin carboxylase [Dehalococcoides mccartyi VS]
MKQLTDDEIYRIAQKRVKEKKEFYNHLSVYIVINLMLISIWAFTGSSYPWFIFPLGGWGIGLIFHFLSVFGFMRDESDWENKEIQKEIGRLKKNL